MKTTRQKMLITPCYQCDEALTRIPAVPDNFRQPASAVRVDSDVTNSFSKRVHYLVAEDAHSKAMQTLICDACNHFCISFCFLFHSTSASSSSSADRVLHSSPFLSSFSASSSSSSPISSSLQFALSRVGRLKIFSSSLCYYSLSDYADVLIPPDP